ncbi:MAG: tyrosine-type recombinase/integrase [Saprospiraceae bacterium]
MIKTFHTIQLSPITHRGEKHIKVGFEREAQLINKIKTIEGRKWSKTKNCWYLPYKKESFEAIERVFVGDKIIYPKSPKSRLAKTTEKVIEENISTVNYSTYKYKEEIRRKVIGKLIIVKQTQQEWIELYVPFDKTGWLNVVRHINGRKWNKEKLCWIIPNVKQSYWLLKEHIELKNIQFDFKIEKNIPESYQFRYSNNEVMKKIKPKGFDSLNENQKKAIFQLEEKIILKRLSHHTLKSYRNILITLFHYFPKTQPEDISIEDVQQYLLHLIKFKKISESTQNQIINAIKAYWEKVLNRQKIRVDIPRPKKPKHLPNVFSQEEVISLIESPENLKHKLILLLIYSAGLRLGELVNIRTRDINISRRVIFIKNGKGKKDRFVTLAEEVLPYLNQYQKKYRPTYWLIEGHTGGQYGKSTVNKVFKTALEKSKVFAFGTVHTLRHSYATHCVENGFSIGLLQEALGHGSIKTTEKYLHISSKALKKMKSPLDLFKNNNRNKVD